ncbi:MAG: hypothetical protein M3P38_07850 [Chloroflexota bacterium]|nr:hypothetical protein [Chloroflexota bacterium]
MQALRILVVAVVASVGAVLLFPVYLAVRAGGSKIFEPERFDFALLAAATFGLALGAQVVLWRRARYIALLALLASGCLLFGVLAALSIGLAVLPAGIVFLVLLYRAIRRRELSSARPAALGGALLGYALVLLYIAQAVPPTAQCFANGAGTSSRRWPGTAQQMYSGGSGTGNDGVFTGHSEYADSVVNFRCEGGRLVEFQRTPR